MKEKNHNKNENIVMIYTTTNTITNAKDICRKLLENKLVECVNIFSDVQSIYWWENKIIEDTEIVIIAKTIHDYADNVISVIKKMHNYSLPCILVLPVIDGYQPYINYIKKVVKG